MALETVTHIADLVITNPTASDGVSQGDDHLRNIKKALLNDFAGFTGAIFVTGTDGGVVDAYTLTPTNALPAYGTKMVALFVPAATNLTTTPTLNISALGAKTIRSVTGAALQAGDLVIGNAYFAEYDGTYFNLTSITKNYADQLAFSTALPAQVADYFLTSNGAVASFSNTLKATVIRFKDGADATKLLAFDLTGITTATTRTVTIPNKSGTMAMLSDVGLVLLAVLTPTAAANVDFLTTFSATYDNYLIIGDGILPAADDSLLCRLATAGAADTGANYYPAATDATVTASATSVSVSVSTVLAAGKGCGFVIHVMNANDATNLKTLIAQCVRQTAATPSYTFNVRAAAYVAANSISGIRFYWNGGSNFSAVGKIRVYGIQNS